MQGWRRSFRDAAQGVKDSDLKTLLYKHSQERSQFSGELQEMVRSVGGDPEKGGSLIGAVHRGWMEIKAAISTNDDVAILNECERGEDSAKKTYQAAIEKPLPDNVLTLVKTQFASVGKAHDEIKSRRDKATEAAKAASASAK